MLKEEIVVGKSYVNEHARVIREVIEEVDTRHIRYNAFDLGTGKLIPAPHQVCHRREMARWADREAALPETGRIHPYEPSAWFDVLSPPEHTSMGVEQARAAIDADPGAHTFPRTK